MSKPTYQSSRSVVYSAKYHLVWWPKYCWRALVAKVEARLVRIISEVCSEHQVEVLGLEIMADHVHLLCKVHPSFGVSQLVRFLKGRSSGILSEEFPCMRDVPSLWTNSWFVSSVAAAPPLVARACVSNHKVA